MQNCKGSNESVPTDDINPTSIITEPDLKNDTILPNNEADTTSNNSVPFDSLTNNTFYQNTSVPSD